MNQNCTYQMAPWGKVLATHPDELSFIPSNHIVEGEKAPMQVVT